MSSEQKTAGFSHLILHHTCCNSESPLETPPYTCERIKVTEAKAILMLILKIVLRKHIFKQLRDFSGGPVVKMLYF